MRTKIVFLPLLIFIFVWLGLNFSGAADKFQSAVAAPTPKSDLSADVRDVMLEKEKVSMICPFDRYLCTKEKLNVKVTTLAENADKNNLTYYYLVSDGKIVGQGASVIWDLSTTGLGKHTITVGVGSGYVIRGKTVTKTIEVEECSVCDPPLICVCPTLSILAPTKSVKGGDSFIVSAKVQGGDEKERITYQWTISGGTIVEGRKAAQILIKTTADMAGSVVKATVEIGGTDPACQCETTVSESILIAKEKP